MAKYFFRLDDIAPNMNWGNFNKLVDIFNRWKIKPLLAVIPDVKDPKLLVWPDNQDFWNIVGKLSGNGWITGQHGYEHLAGGNSGILQIHNSGEFGGLDFESQKSMIASGKEIIQRNGINPEIFIAPRHSFDKNTIKALKTSKFDFISDGIALYPFRKWGIIWLPQILWRPRKGLFGMITVALHLNTMVEKDFENLEKFIEKNQKKIGNFPELTEWYAQSNPIKKMITFFINQAFKIVWWPVFWTKFRISK